MFPELTGRVKTALARFESNSKPITLDLKGAGDIAFDAINAGWYLAQGYPRIYSILTGGMPAWSGESVSLETALNHSVVWACNRIISESVGFIPLALLQRKGNGTREASDDNKPMFSALHDAPNDEITAMSFREMLTSHCLLQGNAYAKITRRSGTGVAIALDPLLPQSVFPDRDSSPAHRLVYVLKNGTDPDKTYTVIPGKPHDILHIRGIGWDGVRGYSVITMARQSIGTSIATERNVANFWKGGGRVPYHLEMEKRFASDAMFDKFRADWEKTYQQPHRAPMLEPGLKYVRDGMSMVDSQLLETRLFDIHEICRWFLVSPHLVGDLSRATFSNIEQLALEFVKMTLSTWIKRWEQELWRCVLTNEEKGQGYFFRHNLNALLRGDFASRMVGYSTMLQNGITSVNEVRDLEDWNPIEGGDAHHIQLNQVTIPGTGAPLTPAATELLTLGTDSGGAGK